MVKKVMPEDMVLYECAICSATYAITKEKDWLTKAGHGDCSCPNGHRWVATETDADRLRKQLSQVIAQRDQAIDLREEMRTQANREYERFQTAMRSRRSTRGVVTRLQKRLAKSEMRGRR